MKKISQSYNSIDDWLFHLSYDPAPLLHDDDDDDDIIQPVPYLASSEKK